MQHHHGGAPPPPPPPPGPHGGVYAHQPPPPPPPPAQTGGIPYIGSRISLISKTDIRYEGFLFNIDTQQSMVALQHVRSFGTEGRRAEHIPPSDQMLPYATFKASEIKDLHVCEAAPPVYGGGPGAYAPPPPMPHQPYAQHPQYAQPPPPPQPQQQQQTQPQPPRQQAPPKAKPASPAKAKPAVPTLLTPGSMSSARMARPPSPHRHELRHEQQQQPPAHGSDEATIAHSRGGRDAGGARTIPGMGGHLLKRKERRVPGGDAEGAAVSTGLDFNFESGLTTFDKEEEFSKLSVNESKAKGSYQKSSFFDTISCDALDRLEGNSNRFSAGQERKLNTETFGAVGLNNNNRRGYRGNRGGNGGRGGGRRNNSGGGQRTGGGRGGNGGGSNWNRNGNPAQA